MKPGTFVRLPDGREATVVYHSLIGYGIRWGRIPVDVEAIYECCPLFGDDSPPEVPEPEALLRNHWPTAPMECVGEEYEVIE